MRILFLHDDIPTDAPPDAVDAVVQAEFIGKVLSQCGIESSRMAFTADLSAMRKRIAAAAPDLVFNLVESVGGAGRLIHLAPALLDAMAVPYTGAGTEAMFLTSNKLLAKRWLARGNMPTPAWAEINRGRLMAHGGAVFPAKYLVKSVWEEASIGIDDSSVILAAAAETLESEIKIRRQQLGGDAFAEVYVDGREFNLSLLTEGLGGCEVLPPAEIKFVGYPADKPRIVTYAAKWDESAFEYVNTTRTFDFATADRPLLDTLSDLARRCWTVFGLRGYARVDFRVDAAGCPFILEVNANPCLAPDAGFMAAAANAGLSNQAVVTRIVEDAR
ncbi:MAG: D-alanine--D-alanine ligase [Phycisphaerae bacterium]|nr:D-alanine--D-alanine ligase [Phycisphaerae bacterium]